MKKHNTLCLLFSVGTILSLLMSNISNKDILKASAANNPHEVDVDEGFVGDPIEYSGAYSNMLNYDGDKGTDQAKAADISEISKSKYDSLNYNDETYVRIEDEDGNFFGVSEETETLTWGIFNALSMKIYKYICVYAHPLYIHHYDDVYDPDYGDSYSYSISKTNSIEENLSLDIGVGAGFGGFVEAGVKYHFETSVALETSFTTTTSYSINNNYVNKNKYINCGITECYMEYLVVTFNHVVVGAGSIFGSGWNFGCPDITLAMIPTVEVLRQFMYSQTFCYEGGNV